KAALAPVQAGQERNAGKLDEILARLGIPKRWDPPSPPRLSRDVLEGRTRELDDLKQLLRPGRTVALYGMAGAGKTLLAEHLANALAGECPGGVLYETIGTELRDPD